MTKYTDKKLTCVVCKKEFIWPAEEQEFFAKKGFKPPLRCPECRKAKKPLPRLFPGTCAKCGKKGIFPSPPGEGPLYCSKCFSSL